MFTSALVNSILGSQLNQYITQFLEGRLQIQSSFHTCDNKSHDQLPLIIYGLVIILTADLLRCGSTEAAGFGGLSKHLKGQFDPALVTFLFIPAPRSVVTLR